MTATDVSCQHSWLSHYPTTVANRARNALSKMVDARLRSDKALQSRDSLLTGSGYPVELSFSTADSRLRYTVEPGSGSLHAAERVSMAISLLADVGGEYDCSEHKGIQSAIRAASPNSFGAWIGARHCADADEYKIYFETSTNASSEAINSFLSCRHADVPFIRKRGQLRMFSYSPKTRKTETYYRIQQVKPQELAFLFRSMKEDRSLEIIQSIAYAYTHQIVDRLPGGVLGISFASVLEEDTPDTITIYFIARSFWGSDSNIRKKYIQLSTETNFNTSIYEDISAACCTARSALTNHGLLGLSVAKDEPIKWSVGLCPPQIH